MVHNDRSLERLVNATLLVPFPDAQPPRWVLAGLADGVAGVCLFANNITDPTQLRGLCAQLRDAGGSPVITLDEEGGDVTRITHDTGSDYPGNSALGAVDDPELTRQVHRELGAELRGLGITMDLAPSVDVNVAAANPVIGTRSFGSDPRLVARHAAAAVTGLQEGGVTPCAKHFPGHGSTRTDSHAEVPVVDADRAVLMQRELPPFVAAIEAGVPAVLTAHIAFPGLGEGGPATLSPRMITGLLRGDLGFDGVVVTDALEMRGASGAHGIPESAVRALLAGCDLLCLGRRVTHEEIERIRAAVIAAVREGRLPADRLEEAAARIAALPTALPATWDAATEAPSTGAGAIGARRAVAVDGPLPSLGDALVVELDTPPTIPVGEVPWGLSAWYPDTWRLDPTRCTAAQVLAPAEGRELVLVLRDAHRHPETRSLVEEICHQRPDTVVVEMGVPVWRPPCRTWVRTYGAARVNAQGAAEVLWGPRTRPVA